MDLHKRNDESKIRKTCYQVRVMSLTTPSAPRAICVHPRASPSYLRSNSFFAAKRVDRSE